jgi:hypothetical protein
MRTEPSAPRENAGMLLSLKKHRPRIARYSQIALCISDSFMELFFDDIESVRKEDFDDLVLVGGAHFLLP